MIKYAYISALALSLYSNASMGGVDVLDDMKEQSPVEVNLALVESDSGLLAKVTFRNKDVHIVHLHKRKIGLEGKFDGPFLDVYCGQEKLSYSGAVIDRADKADDYVELAPEGKITVEVELAKNYPVKSCSGIVRGRFFAGNHASIFNEKHIFLISNIATVDSKE